MPRFEQIRDHLPSLYRPDTDDTSSLVALLLKAVAKSLDTVDREAAEVMQSHWYAYADSALYSPFFLRGFQLLDQPLPAPGDARLKTFPYILSLARMAALLPLPPWRDPASMRELVEAYRTRIRRFVSIYRDGLGTLNAIRRIVEAQLPIDVTAPPGQEDRPFWIEEFAPRSSVLLPAPTRGEPSGRLGPLMRWTVENDGLTPAAAALYIQGSDNSQNPLIELYSTGGAHPRIGIGYRDSLAAAQTLRLRPSFSSWLAGAAGLERSGEFETDPTAPGPWQPVQGTGDVPSGEIAAIHRAMDQALWVAVNAAGTGRLLRFDGRTWTTMLTGLSPVSAFANADSQTLLIGTANALLRLPLFDEGPLAAQAIASFAGRAVEALVRARDGKAWAATDQGLLELAPNQSAVPTPVAGTPVGALHEDRSGTLFIGGDLGLFQRQAGSGHFYWYSGEGATEQQPDWVRLAQLPPAAQVFLPRVTAVHRGPDASLWIGTEQGICRYLARAVQGLAFETALEAFPDLGTMAVHSIHEDERGLVWFATARGLFRFDGRDWWQFQGAEWKQLGRADTIYTEPVSPRGAWRFNRATSRWQRFDARQRQWTNMDLTVRSTAEPQVLSVFWTDGVIAEFGQWDGSQFSDPAPADPAKLVMRFKPDEQRMRDGGLPAVPRLPVGQSVWRYLSMEPQNFSPPAPRPFWTIEGRLIPPPADLDAPGEGRYNISLPPPSSDFNEAVFAYAPEARVWTEWRPVRPLSVLVRLKRRAPAEQIDPVVIDRIWQGIERVRPAGVPVLVALEENVVKGQQ